MSLGPNSGSVVLGALIGFPLALVVIMWMLFF